LPQLKAEELVVDLVSAREFCAIEFCEFREVAAMELALLVPSGVGELVEFLVEAMITQRGRTDGRQGGYSSMNRAASFVNC